MEILFILQKKLTQQTRICFVVTVKKHFMSMHAMNHSKILFKQNYLYPTENLLSYIILMSKYTYSNIQMSLALYGYTIMNYIRSPTVWPFHSTLYHPL